MVKKLLAYFFSDFNLKQQAFWFKKLLYTLLILKSMYWLAYYYVLFGQNAIVFPSPNHTGTYRDLAFILYNSASTSLSLYFILVALSVSVFKLFSNKIYFILEFLLWFSVLNIQNKIYPCLTGGNYLLNQLLFFNCFLSTVFIKDLNWKSDLKIVLHNLGLLAILVQICLLYFLAGFAKILNADWYTGEAISILSQINHYSLYHPIVSLEKKSFITHMLTDVVMYYQLLFPIVVWIKQIKKIVLFIGIVMHLYIGLVMGLPEFAAIMILSYVFFWPIKTSIS